MLSNAYFLAKFRFDTAENEPAKNLQIFEKCIFEKRIFRKCISAQVLPPGVKWYHIVWRREACKKLSVEYATNLLEAVDAAESNMRTWYTQVTETGRAKLVAEIAALLGSMGHLRNC